MKQLVILGAGYGGLLTCLQLEKKTKHLNDVQIILIDRNHYHQYIHLSYEIVTNVKEVSDLTIPISRLIEKRKIKFLQATVREIDLANKIVKTDKGDMPYHRLVVALGSEPNYYKIKGAKENSLSLSSVETAVQIRDELRKTIEQDRDARIVVGGGGFTGVELAGEIADELKCCVTIVEASNTLLPSWRNPALSSKVTQILTQMGTEFVLGKSIVEVKPNLIVLNDGSQIDCSFFAWTGGVQGSQVTGDSGLRIGKGNRVVINEFCQAVGFPSVYVVGDCALVVDPEAGEVLPQCIEIALQQAEVVAENLYADVTHGGRATYAPKFSGLILSVGGRYALGKIFGVHVEGWLAKALKRLMHLHYVYKIGGAKEVLKEFLR